MIMESEKKELNIYQKVFNAKKKFTAISKDQKNPHFKSAYYDINNLLKMVEPVLHEEGLMVMQPIKDGVISTHIIDVETSEMITSSHPLEHNPNPQKVGSEITYYRRYLLSSMLSLQAEDDDGNNSSETSNKKPWLNKGTPQWDGVLKAISEGKVKDVSTVRKKYAVNNDLASELEGLINK